MNPNQFDPDDADEDFGGSAGGYSRPSKSALKRESHELQAQIGRASCRERV